MLDYIVGHSRAPVVPLYQGFDLCRPNFDNRKFGSHEESIKQNKKDHGQEPEGDLYDGVMVRFHDRNGLPGSAKMAAILSLRPSRTTVRHRRLFRRHPLRVRRSGILEYASKDIAASNIQ